MQRLKKLKTMGCLSLLGLGLTHVAQAQSATAVDTSYRFYYYDQKLSMFDIMPDQDNETIWLGDSITDGGEWSELFPKLKTLNRGISADNTFGVLNRLKEVTRRKPARVFILIGINDISKQTPDEVILANYTKIVQRIKRESRSTQIYIQSLLPTNDEFTNFPRHQKKTDHVLAVNEGLRKLAQQEKVTFIDLYTPFLNSENKLDKRFTNDGLHLTGEGYAQWKKVLQPYLDK